MLKFSNKYTFTTINEINFFIDIQIHQTKFQVGHLRLIYFLFFVCLFCFLLDWATEVPVMSVPVVGFSFKPKGLAFVTPLFHLSGYGEGDL